MLNVESIQQAIINANKKKFPDNKATDFYALYKKHKSKKDKELISSDKFISFEKIGKYKNFLVAWYGNIYYDFIEEIINNAPDALQKNAPAVIARAEGGTKGFDRSSMFYWYDSCFTSLTKPSQIINNSEEIQKRLFDLSANIKNALNTHCKKSVKMNEPTTEDIAKEFAQIMLKSIIEDKSIYDDFRTDSLGIESFPTDEDNVFLSLAAISLIALIPSDATHEQKLSIKSFKTTFIDCFYACCTLVTAKTPPAMANKVTISKNTIREAGLNWYRNERSIGHRFEKLIPNQTILPLTYVSTDNTNDTLLTDNKHTEDSTRSDDGDDFSMGFDCFNEAGETNKEDFYFSSTSNWEIDFFNETEEKFLSSTITNNSPIKIHSDSEKEQSILDAIASTTEHLYIIGEGGMGKTTALFSIMKASYDPQPNEDPVIKQIPLFIELSKAYASQDFTGGNSKFIIHSIQRQIQKVIKSKANVETQIEELMSYPQGDVPEFILLLDGFNEVSREMIGDNTIASMVKTEIQSIVENFKNVRFILTSRSNEDMDDNFLTLRLSGINPVNIECYLRETRDLTIPEDEFEQKLDRTKNNLKLMEILRIPLFLVLYSNIKGDIELLSRGEILHTFFNQKSKPHNAELYTEYNRASISNTIKELNKKKNDESISPSMRSVIYDFFLPEIAWEMVRNNELQISRGNIKECIKRILSYFSESSLYFNYIDDCFDEYYLFFNKNLIDIIEKIDTLFGSGKKGERRYTAVSDKICECLTMVLGVLVKNEANNYEIIHQHVRDYFASFYHINKLKMTAYLIDQYDEELADLSRNSICEWVSEPLPEQVLSFIGEALGETHNAPFYNHEANGWEYVVPDTAKIKNERNLLKRCLKPFRNRFMKTDGYTVWNLFQILKLTRKDLSGEDFSNLDLSLCQANGYRLGNGSFAANLNNSKITSNFFLPNSGKGIRSLVYSHNGKFLASLSRDGKIKLLDALSLEELSSDFVGLFDVNQSNDLDMYYDEIFDENFDENFDDYIFADKYIKFNSNDKHLITISATGSATVWDISSNMLIPIKCLNCFSEFIYDVQFSNKGKYLITLSNKRVQVWNGNTFEEETNGTLKGHIGRVVSACFSTDEKYLVTGSYDGTVKVWNTETFCPEIGGTIITSGWLNNADRWRAGQFNDTKYNNIKYACSCYNILDSLAYWVTISHDGEAIIWEQYEPSMFAYSKSWFPAFSLADPTDYVRGVQFSHNGKHLVSISDLCGVQVWDLATFEEISNGAFSEISNIISARFSRDDDLIVTTSTDGISKIWDVNNHFAEIPCESTSVYIDEVFSVQYSPDGNYIAIASYDGGVSIWNAHTYSRVTSDYPLTWNEFGRYSIQFSKDSKKVIIVSGEGRLEKWDTDTIYDSYKDYGWVCSAYFCSDNEHIICSDKTGEVKILNANTFEETPLGNESATYAMYSPDGMYIATVSDTDYAQTSVFVAKNAREVTHKNLSDPDSLDLEVTAEFSSDGRYIITDSYAGIKVWDATSFKRLVVTDDFLQKEAISEPLKYNAVMLSSPKGTYSVATTPDGKKYYLWDANTSENSFDLSIDLGEVEILKFSSEDRFIVTVDKLGTIKIWNTEHLENGPELFEDKLDNVNSVVISPDEKQFLTIGHDNRVKIWDIQNKSLIHTIYDIPGLDVWNLDLSKLHSQTKLSKLLMKQLRDYGATLGDLSRVAEKDPFEDENNNKPVR